ncbi:MOSC domain-containing protein [Bacillus sp. JCM 19034]|uniref:MOSC domain-containing protein n=1 Tax=Bacillus sp. JCM 19034 TaxID=1481928 RepID=UPI000780EB5F|nr:MOSC domain-containing protein [Bacillus sp. JCM 19034]
MYTIKSLNIGKIETLEKKREQVIKSGIMKQPIDNKNVYLSKISLEGDEQADLVNHGGVDKAVCIYPTEHLSYWEQRYNKSFNYGAFGENVSIAGLTENIVCIGDQFSWGEALIEISQPRSPCFKVALKHQVKQLPLHIQETGYSGYYVRVIKEGYVSVNEPFKLHKKGTDISIAYVNELTYSKKVAHKQIKDLLVVPALSNAWKKTLEKKLK